MAIPTQNPLRLSGFCRLVFPGVLALGILLPASTSHAEEPVRSTQEELRRRNVYFGEIDGRRSDEYAEALKRYQRRKGLSASGQEDRNTLRSLGLLPRSADEAPPKELDWPEETVLKSDSRLDVIVASQELADEAGYASLQLTPIDDKGRALPRATGSRPRAQPMTNTPARPSRGAQPVVLSFRNSQAMGPALSSFVRDYVRAVGRDRLKDELHFYADRVDYFGQKQVDRRVIEQALRRYYSRWPDRSYAIVGQVGYRSVPSRGEVVVTYRTEFTLKNGRNRAKGQVDNLLVINAATSDPRIVSIEEKRVRR